MGDVRITSPRVTVIRDGHEPLEVQTANPDLVLWDRTRIRHKWPKFDEAPFLWLTFISWAAARRTGAISPELRYEAWEESVMDVSSKTEEGAETGAPFPPGVDPV